jgi:tRNA(Ile)-lysidine synthase
VNHLRLVVSGERILITQLQQLPPDEDWPRLDPCQEVEIPIPGELQLTGGWHFLSEWHPGAPAIEFSPGEISSWEAWLDAETLAGPLALRCSLPGDRFQPLGFDGHTVKLSDFWINQKLPSRARSNYPLVVTAGQIAWVPGFRLAHPFRIVESTRKVLHLRLTRLQI